MFEQYSETEIQNAREYAAKINYEIARAAQAGEIWINTDEISVEEYAHKHIQTALEIESGESDHNSTIWQRMNYYLTGDCPALLP